MQTPVVTTVQAVVNSRVSMTGQTVWMIRNAVVVKPGVVNDKAHCSWLCFVVAKTLVTFIVASRIWLVHTLKNDEQ